MISPKDFFDSLNQSDVGFFTGVPDSLLKDMCAFISDNTAEHQHIIAANEGSAIALGIGYHLATKKIPLVYMQNSGFGNAINPLLSLIDNQVYSIPMLLLVGWRGEPGVNDEPQHVKQGHVSESILKTLNIPYVIISSETQDIKRVISDAARHAQKHNTGFVLLVRKGTFRHYSLKSQIVTHFDLTREQAIIKTTNSLSKSDVIVATTGKASRELFEHRSKMGQGYHRDFLTVGGMGHANQIALGIALAKPQKRVYCFDGDGAVLMHAGALGIIGQSKSTNFRHIIFNNGSHDSVGGQPTIGFNVSFEKIAQGFGYHKTFKIEKEEQFETVFTKFQKESGPSLLEIMVNKGARKDLGRPSIQPKKNKHDFMTFLDDE